MSEEQVDIILDIAAIRAMINLGVQECNPLAEAIAPLIESVLVETRNKCH